MPLSMLLGIPSHRPLPLALLTVLAAGLMHRHRAGVAPQLEVALVPSGPERG